MDCWRETVGLRIRIMLYSTILVVVIHGMLPVGLSFK